MKIHPTPKKKFTQATVAAKCKIVATDSSIKTYRIKIKIMTLREKQRYVNERIYFQQINYNDDSMIAKRCLFESEFI